MINYPPIGKLYDRYCVTLCLLENYTSIYDNKLSKYTYKDLSKLKDDSELIGYFINKYYILNNISKIKYENNIFYSYYNTKWNKIQLIDIYDNFIEKMLEELYKYKFLIINNTIKKVNEIDLDNDYYEFKEQLNDRPYKYILKYNVQNIDLLKCTQQ
jgi:hypothetical protein